MIAEKQTTILALCGKGGVGKTSLAALMTKIFTQHHDLKVLAIDADPAVGLSTALGISVDKTVDDIRNDIIDRIKDGNQGSRQELIASIDYGVFEALHEDRNFAFLAIGRPETDGCYCQVNDLLKDIISDMAKGFDIVIIDGEAGVEQVNRRVMQSVTHLFLVADTSVKACQVADSISKVASFCIDYSAVGLLLNRVRDAAEVEKARCITDLPIWAVINENKDIYEFDRSGRSFISMPDNDALTELTLSLKQLNLLP